MSEFSHTDEKGKARMVDVSAKNITLRTAEAQATVLLNKETFEAVRNNTVKKGDVLAVAKIAGIQGGKKTAELIPLCHNIFISHIDLDFIFDDKKNAIVIRSKAVTESQTGIEMEAMTSVVIAAVTIYDMCKAMDKSITITDVMLISKKGGKSGEYKREK